MTLSDAGIGALPGPPLGETVTLVVPQREQLSAQVENVAATWVDLLLLNSPRTSWAQLTRARVSVQFVGLEGLCQMTGQIDHRPQDAGQRVAGYGSGEVLRFTHRGQVQLLRGAAHVTAQASAPLIVLRLDGPDEVAVEARCVAVSGAGLQIRGLPDVASGDRYAFDLQLDPHAVRVQGELRVDQAQHDGLAETSFTTIEPGDRRRLVHWATQHGAAAVA